MPTDTVYGLAVDPTQPEAVARLFALKGRPDDVPLPVLVAGPEQVALVAGHLGPAAQHLAERFWPGPLTLVVPRRRGFTVDLGGPPAARQTVGVRRPDHPVVVALCELLGPLAVTSANLHGADPGDDGRRGGAGVRRVGRPGAGRSTAARVTGLPPPSWSAGGRLRGACAKGPLLEPIVHGGRTGPAGREAETPDRPGLTVPGPTGDTGGMQPLSRPGASP